MMITKPMLAGKAPSDLSQLQFPLLATPKLDGIRCLVINGKAVSRTFKPIPNDHIRTQIEWAARRNGFGGVLVDGEILVRNRTFNELSGDVRRSEGKPDFYYAVFDLVVPGVLREPYADRMADLDDLSLPSFCEKILPAVISNPAALLAYEEKCIAEGYEGVMVRSPSSPYKCGRSSTNEGYLLKIKRFEDDEAMVIGVEEMNENQNIAERDAFGRTKRSKHAENMVPKGTMGQLTCRMGSGVEFGLGTGYDLATRNEIWAQHQLGKVVGRYVKFRHQPSGAKEKPRFPSFLAFREKWDL